MKDIYKIFKRGMAVTMPTNEKLSGNVAYLEKVGLHYGEKDVDDDWGIIKYPGLDLTLEVPLAELKPCSFSIECVLNQTMIDGTEKFYGKSWNPNTTNLGVKSMALGAIQEAIESGCKLSINIKQF